MTGTTEHNSMCSFVSTCIWPESVRTCSNVELLYSDIDNQRSFGFNCWAAKEMHLDCSVDLMSSYRV